ncbi:MAG: hypothetical protein FWG66_13775 [Spirochaetes bacterium]|nr:hypothetical protein [Spirochaetota bacterium]
MKEYDTTLKYHAFSVHFNPFLQHTEWDEISGKAQQYFIGFLNEKNYGDDVISMSFNFFVEKEVDYDKQDDNISTASYFGVPKNARLNLHFEHDFFVNASCEIKYAMTLNGIFYLLCHWNDNLKILKNTPLKEIIKDFQNKLIEDNMYDADIAKNYIKLMNPFRFMFMKNYFYGLKEKHILFDTNDIEKYLNNNLHKYNFGKSIKEVFFYYDIFDFDNKAHQQYIDEEKEYSYGKQKDLIITEQYDSKIFYMETKSAQLKYLHKGILNAIERIEHMKRKPKDFNYKEFYKVMEKLMNEYEELGNMGG